MCFEWNDHGNEARGAQVKDACAAHDLVFTIWLTRPFDAQSVRQAIVQAEPVGVSLEAEIPGFVPEAVDWESVVAATADMPVHKSVVTNFAAFVTEEGLPDPSKSKPLVDAGWKCLTECYLGEAPNATPENLDFYARAHLGWPATQPVIGLQRGKTFADYPTRDNYRNWSVWDASEALV